MKLKALLLACAVAGFTASFALADDGGHHGGHHGEHHGTTTTMTTATTTTAANACTEVELKGTLGTVAANSFTLTVAKQNGGGDDENGDDEDDDNDNNGPAVPNLVGQTVTIAVNADTKVSFKVTGALRGPATGDMAKVKAEACGTGAAMTLTADKVKAEAATAATTATTLAAHKASKSHHKSHK